MKHILALFGIAIGIATLMLVVIVMFGGER